jgi:hypothetical protein
MMPCGHITNGRELARFLIKQTWRNLDVLLNTDWKNDEELNLKKQ